MQMARGAQRVRQARCQRHVPNPSAFRKRDVPLLAANQVGHPGAPRREATVLAVNYAGQFRGKAAVSSEVVVRGSGRIGSLGFYTDAPRLSRLTLPQRA
jgi:hypothetical protein